MYHETRYALEKIRNKKPLILNITNEVTLDFVANGLLSLGASPVMSKAPNEIEDLMQLTGAVVINLGTLNPEFIQLCQQTCRLANQANKPIILDPVGAGASRYRTEAAWSLIQDYRIAIIRGNASEILTLSGACSRTQGVDSSAQTEDAVEAGMQLAKHYQATIVISGKRDFIIDAHAKTDLDCGSAMMPYVTGTGCLLTAVIAAFHAVDADRFQAATLATLFYGRCGERAANQAQGPGSFRSHFLDALHGEAQNES